MKERVKSFNPVEWSGVKLPVIAYVLCALMLPVVLYFAQYTQPRRPIEMRYDHETDELVVTPGKFYSLTGHTEEPFSFSPYEEAQDSVINFTSDSESEYRFAVIPRKGFQFLTIYVHDNFTKQDEHFRFRMSCSAPDERTRSIQLSAYTDDHALCWDTSFSP